MSEHAFARRAGLLLPLFSFPSSTSWGIGEIGDVARLVPWLSGAGQHVLQLLPLNEMASGGQSPYSALSAMAIDPIYLTLADVPDVAALGGDTALTPDERRDLEQARGARRVDYPTVRRLKARALAAAFERFLEAEWRYDTTRARDLGRFIAGESWWLDDYALYRALHEREGHRPWTAWPDGLRGRDHAGLAAARGTLEREILFRQYLQWLADAQWRGAREAARAAGVKLFGDLPFMVDGDSADVWARQDEFRLDASVGVPPDAFSATGQDWGMPAYDWDTCEARDFAWLRARARRSAALYDGYRVDHLVGFYRTYSKLRAGGMASFSPPDETSQLKLGERVLAIFREPGTEIVAEDLGVVPDFVRESLARLAVPGFKVFRWERAWHTPDQPFHDPAAYPPLSVAVSGTHDTETLAVWWEQASADDKQKVADIASIRRLLGSRDLLSAPFIPVVRDVLLEVLFACGSNLLVVPVQDVFGWRDRINEPATVTAENWTFRLPWPVEHLSSIPDAWERQQTLRHWAARHGRTG